MPHLLASGSSRLRGKVSISVSLKTVKHKKLKDVNKVIFKAVYEILTTISSPSMQVGCSDMKGACFGSDFGCVEGCFKPRAHPKGLAHLNFTGLYHV